jgi:hypothetical protein
MLNGTLALGASITDSSHLSSPRINRMPEYDVSAFHVIHIPIRYWIVHVTYQIANTICFSTSITPNNLLHRARETTCDKFTHSRVIIPDNTRWLSTRYIPIIHLQLLRFFPLHLPDLPVVRRRTQTISTYSLHRLCHTLDSWVWKREATLNTKEHPDPSVTLLMKFRREYTTRLSPPSAAAAYYLWNPLVCDWP